MIKTWREAVDQKRFLFEFLIVLVALLLILLFLPYYFQEVIGPRPGKKLYDPLLIRMTPMDFSIEIFSLIYLTIVIVVWEVIKHPLTFLLGLESYLVITCLRMFSMYLFTLEPPDGIIPLHDPIIDRFVYGGTQFEKDLFFSGHVATLSLLASVEHRHWMKLLVVAITAVVAVLILKQRVHYTIDVIVSPFVTLAVVRVLGKTGLQQKVSDNLR